MKIDLFLKMLNKFELGKIITWNGTCNYKVYLDDLRRGLNCYIEDLNNILAIIIFGSSVYEFPKYIEKEIKYKKYGFFKGGFFGKETIKIEKEENYVKPNDLDILIITKDKFFNNTKIKNYRTTEYSDGYGIYQSRISMNIDFKNVSIEELKNGIKNKDSVILNALKKGVLLVKKESFDLDKFKIKNISNRKVVFEDDNSILNIEIN